MLEINELKTQYQNSNHRNTELEKSNSDLEKLVEGLNESIKTLKSQQKNTFDEYNVTMDTLHS